ncbi:MAG: hypothetical protein ABJC39_09960 [Chloroflexota bacterium]
MTRIARSIPYLASVLLAVVGVVLMLVGRGGGFGVFSSVGFALGVLIAVWAVLVGTYAWAASRNVTTAIEVLVTAVAILAIGLVGIVLDRQAGVTVGWSDEKLAVIADGARAFLALTALLAAYLAVRRKAWPEYGVATLASLAAISIGAGVFSTASGQFDPAPDAVPAPRLAVTIRRASVIGSTPDVNKPVSVIVLVPTFDQTGKLIENTVFQFAGQLVEPIGAADTNRQVDATIEFTRGDADVKVQDVLRKLGTTGRTVFLATAAP